MRNQIVFAVTLRLYYGRQQTQFVEVVQAFLSSRKDAEKHAKQAIGKARVITLNIDDYSVAINQTGSSRNEALTLAKGVTQAKAVEIKERLEKIMPKNTVLKVMRIKDTPSYHFVSAEEGELYA